MTRTALRLAIVRADFVFWKRSYDPVQTFPIIVLLLASHEKRRLTRGFKKKKIIKTLNRNVWRRVKRQLRAKLLIYTRESFNYLRIFFFYSERSEECIGTMMFFFFMCPYFLLLSNFIVITFICLYNIIFVTIKVSVNSTRVIFKYAYKFIVS